MVSGGVALVAQAFPNHTPEQLVDRILASANNIWFTPTGNTTFTTHGASIKHGYHTTWGHGVPDFYAAMSPITTSSNPLSFAASPSSSSSSTVNGSSVPFSNVMRIPISLTSITQSSSIGDAIKKGLAGKTTYAYDALNGGFKYDLSNFVTSVSPEDQKIEIDFAEELNVLRNLDISNDKFSKKKIIKENLLIFQMLQVMV